MDFGNGFNGARSAFSGYQFPTSHNYSVPAVFSQTHPFSASANCNKVDVMLRPRSVSIGVRHTSGAHDKISFTVRELRVSDVRALSDERTGL
jgi:hypothetical protein